MDNGQTGLGGTYILTYREILWWILNMNIYKYFNFKLIILGDCHRKIKQESRKAHIKMVPGAVKQKLF